MRALHGEFVRRADKWQLCEFCNFGSSRLGEPWRRIDPGTDRGAAEGEAVNALERIVNAFKIVGQHASVARPFLPERNGCRVLHMGTTDLDDIGPFGALRRDRVMQGFYGGDQTLRHIHCGGDVHRRRKTVVRRLRHVDVIVRVNRFLAAERRARELAAPVGDHLVHIHVELGAAAGHPDMQRKHVVMLAGQDFIADLNDQLVDPVIEPFAGVVCIGRGFLQGRIGRDHLARDEILADAEMLE